MAHHDTIAAIATAPGQGGIGIIRISGDSTQAIAAQLLGKPPQPRHAHFTSYHDATDDLIDQGILLFFAKPASFTGEDVVELQIHGGPVVLDRLLKHVIHLGCRQARAGEFSERAFLNDRIDLLQAEAIADLISAESEQSARAAAHSLQGDFSGKIQSLLQALTQLRIHVESALDFPEEEIDFIADEAIARQLEAVIKSTEEIKLSSRQGKLLSEGLNIVITGKPNAGKSSLLNALAGFDSAIVSDQPGTTRDVIREKIQLEGVPLHIIDTAGMRESSDDIEQEGVRRAKAEIERADIVIRVVDSLLQDDDEPIPGEILVRNKIDLGEQAAGREADRISLSARSGEGMQLLKDCILDRAGYDSAVQQEGLFTARQRHVDAINRLHDHLDEAGNSLARGDGEIMAEELRQAQNILAEITGEFSSDDLLGRIFSEFCIGK
jgi:tRNA modification GTPase